MNGGICRWYHCFGVTDTRPKGDFDQRTTSRKSTVSESGESTRPALPWAAYPLPPPPRFSESDDSFSGRPGSFLSPLSPPTSLLQDAACFLSSPRDTQAHQCAIPYTLLPFPTAMRGSMVSIQINLKIFFVVPSLVPGRLFSVITCCPWWWWCSLCMHQIPRESSEKWDRVRVPFKISATRLAISKTMWVGRMLSVHSVKKPARASCHHALGIFETPKGEKKVSSFLMKQVVRCRRRKTAFYGFSLVN